MKRTLGLPIVEANEFSLRFVGRARGDSLTGTAVGKSPLGLIQQGRIEAARVDSTRRR